MVFLALGAVVFAGPAIHNLSYISRSDGNDEDSNNPVSQEASSTPAAEVSGENEIPATPSSTSSESASPTSSTESEISSAPNESSVSSTLEPSSTTPVSSLVATKPRKSITFDQRQQGKFNIRADLENFVIVVVPSSPSAGISLLDLLNRNGAKNQHKKKSSHRKNTKNHGISKKTQHITPEVVVLDDSQSHARVDNEEFIEGRTPYKVDISSTARSSNSDLPSPIYRVVRPFTFNVEQPTSSNMIRFPSPSGNYYASTVRESKSLPEPAPYNDELRTNTVYTILTNNKNGDGGIDRIEDGGTDDNDYLLLGQRTYLDLPASSDSSFDSLEFPHSDVDMAKLQLQEDNQRAGDGWELKLLGAQEQCGPDRKRDSYGVCQFVTP